MSAVIETVERIRVRYGETDQMGHAYYANYLYWWEQARGAFCRDRGFSYAQIEELGYFLPVVEVAIKYRAEIKYDDTIKVHVSAAEIRRAAIWFEYRIFRPDGVLASEGSSWHVLMGQERKAVSIPPQIREWLERNPGDFPTLA